MLGLFKADLVSFMKIWKELT
jgi:hypothetical protein